MIKFPDFSRHFKWLLTGLDPRNSSDKKRNACYFMTFLWQQCSSIYSNGITSAYTDVKLIYRVGLYCTFCIKINTHGNWPYARTHFPWSLLNSLTFPGFQGSPGEWPPRKSVRCASNNHVALYKLDYYLLLISRWLLRSVLLSMFSVRYYCI